MTGIVSQMEEDTESMKSIKNEDEQEGNIGGRSAKNVFVGNSFHVAGSWCAKERCPYDFVFIVGIMIIRLSEEKHMYLAGVYTWVRLDSYAVLESIRKTKHREQIYAVLCQK